MTRERILEQGTTNGGFVWCEIAWLVHSSPAYPPPRALLVPSLSAAAHALHPVSWDIPDLTLDAREIDAKNDREERLAASKIRRIKSESAISLRRKISAGLISSFLCDSECWSEKYCISVTIANIMKCTKDQLCHFVPLSKVKSKKRAFEFNYRITLSRDDLFAKIMQYFVSIQFLGQRPRHPNVPWKGNSRETAG